MKRFQKDRLYNIKKIIYTVITSLYFWAIIFSIIFDFRFNSHPDIIEIIKNKSIVSAIMFLLYVISFILLLHIVRFITATTKPLFNNEIITRVNELIDSAAINIYIITPYFNIGNVFIEKLLSAANDGVEVVIIHNTSENNKIEFQKIFNRLAPYGVIFYNHPRLHAKLYLNESEAIITSLNLLSGSIDNSIESGIYIHKKSAFKKIYGFVQQLLNPDLLTRTNLEKLPTNGYCIKSKKDISFNKNKPIEYKTYLQAQDNIGKYCHYCGVEANTSLDNPFCKDHQSMN